MDFQPFFNIFSWFVIKFLVLFTDVYQIFIMFSMIFNDSVLILVQFSFISQHLFAFFNLFSVHFTPFFSKFFTQLSMIFKNLSHAWGQFSFIILSALWSILGIFYTFPWFSPNFDDFQRLRSWFRLISSHFLCFFKIFDQFSSVSLEKFSTIFFII